MGASPAAARVSQQALDTRREVLDDVVRDPLVALGETCALGFASLVSATTRRPTWVREFLRQCAFITRTVLVPAMLINYAFGISAIGLGGGTALDQLGTLDRNAAFAPIGLLREFGVFMTGSVFAGILGTTIAAELGARKVRDELDALAVIGVDVVHALVVPRMVASCLMSVVVLLFGFVAGSLGVYTAVTVFFGSSGAPFVSQLLSNTNVLDLYASVGKVLLFGFLIAVIACQKGLSTKGGAEGVGRSVNQAVVACLVAVFFVSLVYTQFFLALEPDLGAYR